MSMVKAQKEHRAFVLATWLRSSWASYGKLAGIDYDLFFKEEARLAEKRFDAGLVQVVSPDGYTVNGWLAGKPKTASKPAVIFWMYVAPELRGMGLGTRMIADSGIGPGADIVVAKVENTWLKKSKLPLGQFNPYRLTEL